MNKQQLITYLEHPEEITPDVVPQLKELLKVYPFFQTGHVLLLKSMYNLNDVLYENYLAKLAVYAGNRELLYDYILGKKQKVLDEPNTLPTLVSKQEIVEENKPKTKEKQDSYFDSVTVSNDYFSLSHSSENSSEDAFDGVHSFSHWLEMMSQKRSTPPEETPAKRNKKWELIDSFIKEKPEIRSPKPDGANMHDEIHDLTEKSSAETEEFMTETLARIYIKQKNYSKALHIFKKLSLKYPEKSIYFAGQIKIIEQLKNNEK